jgi:hypothetical protein
MSSHAARAVACCLTAVVLGSCGDDSAPTPPPKAGAGAPGAPALLRAATQPGEVVVSGEASPLTRGPFEFDGRYLVRFAQYAPEAPRTDFRGETPFVAALGPAKLGPGARSIRLFRAAARSGRRVLEIHGRHTVDVSFGDYPFVIRFSPAG